MIKNLPKKEIKTLIPDYVFDLLDKSEKDSFEEEIKKYPDLQKELHETQALFDKVNINNINKYNDEQIDSITSDLSDNVINKLNELNTNKNIQPIDNKINNSLNSSKKIRLNKLLPISIAAALVILFAGIIYIFNLKNNNNSTSSGEFFTQEEKNIIQEEFDNNNTTFEDYISMLSANGISFTDSDLYRETVEDSYELIENKDIYSILDIDYINNLELDEYMQYYNDYNDMHEIIINELDNLNDEEFSILMENF